MLSRITIKDVNNITSIGKSYRGSKIFEKEFYQMSMRPTIISNDSQKKDINSLQKEIEKHQMEILLLKEKLEFKNKIENYR